MEIFAKAYDVKVWRVIKKGNYPLPASTPPLADPHDIDSYSKEKLEAVQVNNKARNLLHNAISGEEYEKISSCDTAKEMWDKLEVTYEGTSKVKETHINMLVHDYRPFSMKEGESIEEMFARFSKIISDLMAFGKPYTSGDQVRKILRMRGELIAFERTHLKKTNQEEKKKIVAFKTSTEMAENEIDDPEALQEEIAMMSRNMDGLMRRYRNTKKGRFPPRRSRQYNEQDKNDGKCYECGCWTDEDDSDDENCFMARGETSEVRSYDCERCDKNLFKEVTKINGGSVKFRDDSRGKIVGTGTIPFNNNCDITEVYLVDSLNYNLLSISQLCDSGYEVKFKRIGVLLKTNQDEAIRNFEVFGKKVEREKGYLISKIQSDHGGEFESRAFEDFCNDQGYTYNFFCTTLTKAKWGCGKEEQNSPRHGKNYATRTFIAKPFLGRRRKYCLSHPQPLPHKANSEEDPL
ncbi:PREDICTED: uncharacterized protein LOC109221530 [Nicotiana attenuata]|uniref:uncharacterized protein LOC109221530 n=1 Tax=Nicotiana attenuata TaxID=49451 RepID=UPI000905B899|nr:PREDICTED: uncharacterized protein LOC109221530 [Nicotiana attenuata]